MLSAILCEEVAPPGLSLNRLLQRTQARGSYLFIILLCLPFVVPVALPGLSTLMGGIIGILSLQLALGQSTRLPSFLGERVISPGSASKLLGGSIRFLRVLERVIKPRRTAWLGSTPARTLNALLIAALACLLALPLPSPPFFFSNSLPGYAIILIAASMMEEDGVLIWVGYACVVANLVFFGLIAGLVLHLLAHGWQFVLKLLSGS